ncbi:MAG: flagellar hook-length control protein FliK [Pseudomonadota bacterium]
MPIINLNSVSSESISTLSDANSRSAQSALEQQFLARNITLKSDSVSMEVEINGRWQTIRLTIEPQTQKLELPEAQVTLDETGLKLTLQTPKYGIQIKAADQLLTLMNFLKGDSIGANITTHAEAKLSPASLQLPKLGINLAINPSLAKMLSAEPKLIAQLRANTSQLSLTVNDRFDEQLLQQPISKHKIAQSLANNTPSILLNISEKTPKIQHPLTKAILPLSNAEKLTSQSEANIWRATTPVVTINGLEISEKPKQYAIQLKHSAKSMLAQTTNLKTADSSTPLRSNLSYDKPLLDVSLSDVKQAVRAALQKIIKAPFIFTNNRSIKDVSPTQINTPSLANELPSLNKGKDLLPFIYPEAKNSKADPIVQLFSQIKQIVSTAPQLTITTPLKVPNHLQITSHASLDTTQTKQAGKIINRAKTANIENPQKSQTNTTSNQLLLKGEQLAQRIDKEVNVNNTTQQKKDLSQQLAKPFTNESSLNKSEQSQTQKPTINMVKAGAQPTSSSNMQATQAQQKQTGQSLADGNHSSDTNIQNTFERISKSTVGLNSVFTSGTPNTAKTAQVTSTGQPALQNTPSLSENKKSEPPQTKQVLFAPAIKTHYVPTGSIEKQLMTPFILEPNTHKSDKAKLEISSEQINKLASFKESKSPDLTRLVHQAFARMIDEKQHSASQVFNELNLPHAINVGLNQPLANSNLQTSGLLNNVEKLLLTLLSSSRLVQNESNPQDTEAKFDALLKTLQPNFKAQNISQLQQQLPNLNSPLMNELVQINNSLQHNMSQSINQSQNQSSDAQLLISLFLPTKLPDNCKQTHLQVGNYKKPAKGNLPEKTVWYIRLNFDYASAGKLSVQAELMDKSVECQITGNSNQVCKLAEPHLDTLRRKLSAHGLQVGDVELIEDAAKAEQFFNQHAIVNIQV